MYSYKIINQSELPTWRKKITLQGKKICATNGCFDLLHAGHIKYLYESSKYADVLIIGCNGDESVRSLKGKKRPIQKEKDRAIILSALECVSFVSIFKEKEATNFLKAVKPDFYIKGGDYTLDSINKDEKEAVTKNGGTIIFAPMSEGKSSSFIISKINNV
jgi:rfaE bifunctional protein nucleotidyltransferase chain/domain|tara:strand:+ start:1363 stop:1845 length:483 start_codon:yes stop_codon:yes gene_type:complete